MQPGSTLIRSALLVCSFFVSVNSLADTELRIGTASLGGAYYPMGQALSNSISRYADGYTMVPIVTGGGAENPRLVASKGVDLAIAPANLSYFARKGTDPYENALDIYALGNLHASVLHIVSLDQSGIRRIEDLRGLNVAVGPKGGGTISAVRNLFEIYDMKITDIKPHFLSYADGFSQLTDGSIDVVFAMAGFPASAVVQARFSEKLFFLQLEDEKKKELLKEYPYYSSIEVPKDVYGTDAPISVIASANLLVAPGEMEEKLAFMIAQAIYDNMPSLRAENPLAAKIDPKQSLELPIPLHPGAARYFEKFK